LRKGGLMNYRHRETSQFYVKEDKTKPEPVDIDSYMDVEEAEKQIDDFRRKWKDLDSGD
jgi:hypothetical protein